MNFAPDVPRKDYRKKINELTTCMTKLGGANLPQRTAQFSHMGSLYAGNRHRGWHWNTDKEKKEGRLIITLD